MALDHSEQFQGKHDGGNDDGPFDEDVVAPVFRERRVGFGHRAISHVVPSLESLMTTPIAASSSRIRSDSLKSFRARAAARTSSRPSTLVVMPRSADAEKIRPMPTSCIAPWRWAGFPAFRKE